MRTHWCVFVGGLAVAAGLLSFRSLAEGDERSLTEMVLSSQESDRHRAEQTVIRQQREEIEALIGVVRRPVRKGESFFTSSTSRNTAIRLLGRLRAREAVSDLIPLLAARPGQDLGIDEITAMGPAGYALVDIGLPAVSPLIEELKKQRAKSGGFDDLAAQCMRSLVCILGPENTKYLVQKARAAERDPTERRNLADALTHLSSQRFVPRVLGLIHKDRYGLP